MYCEEVEKLWCFRYRKKSGSKLRALHALREEGCLLLAQTSHTFGPSLAGPILPRPQLLKKPLPVG